HAAADRPALIARPAEVVRLHPGRRLLPVPPPCPTPQLPHHHVIHVCKRPLARRMPVIQRPAPNLRVEPLDQLPGRAVPTVVLDHVVDLRQERPYALAGRLPEKLGPVTTHVLPQEVEAVVDLRDAG